MIVHPWRDPRTGETRWLVGDPQTGRGLVLTLVPATGHALEALEHAGLEPVGHDGVASFFGRLDVPPAEPPWAPVVRGPDGAPEVDVPWVLAHRNRVRMIDVREPEEHRGPLGHLPEAERVPMAKLARRAEGWRRETPLILISGTGERARSAALALEDMGFRFVAALRGGMRSLPAGLDAE